MEDFDGQSVWERLSPQEKKRLLFEKQKLLLGEFLGRGAISKAQYEKSLHDLKEKMGFDGLE